MKKPKSDITPAELAYIERAKEVLLEAAPFISVLEEKLRNLDTDFKAINSGSDSPLTKDLERYLSASARFNTLASSAVSAEAEVHSDAVKAAWGMMNKGMDKPGHIPKRKELEQGGRVSERWEKNLLGLLTVLRDELEGQETPASYAVRRSIDDCVSYMKGTLLPELERRHFDENMSKALLVLSHGDDRKKLSYAATSVIAAGLAMAGLGGYATVQARRHGGYEAVGEVMGATGLVFAGAGATYGLGKRRLIKAQEKERENIFPDDPPSR